MSKGSGPRKQRNDKSFRDNYDKVFKKEDNDRYKPYKPKLTKKGDDGLTLYTDDKSVSGNRTERN
jgi:hypothetical protein